MRIPLAAFALAALAACAPVAAPPSAPAPASTTPTAAAAAPVRLEIHWTRGSAEHRAAFLQTYRMAGERLREMAAGLPAGSWAVILDADETVLDNSTYQKRIADAGQGYQSETWNAWVRERAAPALPGAAEFTQLARSLGGRVAIVTNRDDVVCEPTRENLRRVNVVFDVALCRPPESGDKNPRFQAVERGAAIPGAGPLRVLMWVGDNIQDFPGLGQDVRTQPDAAFAEFGRRFIVLPNPMYGSWERNPVQ